MQDEPPGPSDPGLNGNSKRQWGMRPCTHLVGALGK